MELYPLNLYYEERKRFLPEIESVAPEKVPEPYHTLLVHEGDMTSHLQDHHRSDISLTVLEVEKSNTHVRREVVLNASIHSPAKPVEYGVIHIHLEPFDESVTKLITDGIKPLGGILNEFEIPHYSRPKEYFHIRPTTFILEKMNLSSEKAPALYGRTNILYTGDGKTIAEIVEILTVD